MHDQPLDDLGYQELYLLILLINVDAQQTYDSNNDRDFQIIKNWFVGDYWQNNQACVSTKQFYIPQQQIQINISGIGQLIQYDYQILTYSSSQDTVIKVKGKTDDNSAINDSNQSLLTDMTSFPVSCRFSNYVHNITGSEGCLYCENNDKFNCKPDGCDVGFFLTFENMFIPNRNFCKRICPDGGTLLKSVIPTAYKCITCIQNCQICSDFNHCDQCMPGYALNPQNTCTMLPCPEGCQSCTDNKSCTSCLTGYTQKTNPNNNTLQYCQLNCLAGQYSFIKDNTQMTQECRSCIPLCQSCTGPSDCSNCQSGYGYNSQAAQCQIPCPSGCSSCTENKSCTSCLSGYTQETNPNDNTLQYCQMNCQTGYYSFINDNTLMSQECRQCIPLCQSCTGPNNCSNCQSGYGYNSQAQQCYCTEGCSYCDQNISCTLCNNGYTKTQNPSNTSQQYCKLNCPQGQYTVIKDQQIMSQEYKKFNKSTMSQIMPEPEPEQENPLDSGKNETPQLQLQSIQELNGVIMQQNKDSNQQIINSNKRKMENLNVIQTNIQIEKKESEQIEILRLDNQSQSESQPNQIPESLKNYVHQQPQLLELDQPEELKEQKQPQSQDENLNQNKYVNSNKFTVTTFQDQISASNLVNLDIKLTQNELMCIQKFQRLSLFVQFKILHTFFNTIYTYDPDLSRAIRFNLFYLRIIHSLCLSTVFDETYNISQQIIISIVSSIIIVAGVFLVTLVHKVTRIGQKLSALLMVCLLGFYYYVILAVVSNEEASYANSKYFSFFLIIGVDIIVIQSILSIIKISILKNILKHAIIFKLYSVFGLNKLIASLTI
ncbi:hypothetical protein ABPG73_022859 [Tetrahymena malaccensis]